jgi:hypothetical protein
MVQPERPQMTCITRRKRFACWITKATEHSEYVNISCFCTAAMVARTRLNITFIRTPPVLFIYNLLVEKVGTSIPKLLP